MNPFFVRMESLIGIPKAERLYNAHVMILGLGGVGGMVLEALARCGIGHFTLIDGDRLDESNLNRQILATTDQLGKPKVEAGRARVFAINPEARVTTVEEDYSPYNGSRLLASKPDYVVDAIDTMSAKLDLAERCEGMAIPLIASMGTGNKLDPSGFVVMDIFETKVDPVARVMRHELKKRGIGHLKVVSSMEEPRMPEIPVMDPIPPVRSGQHRFCAASGGIGAGGRGGSGFDGRTKR